METNHNINGGFYIAYKFNLPVVNIKIFNENSSDVFAVNADEALLKKLVPTSFSKYSSSNRTSRFIILDLEIELAEKQFAHLCEEYRQFNIHWLKIESESLVWQKSKGDIKSLEPYLDMNSSQSDYGCITWQRINYSEVNISVKIDTLDLYEQFIDRKWYIWVKEALEAKSVIALWNAGKLYVESAKPMLRNLSLYALFEEHEMKVMFTVDKIMKLDREISEIKNGRRHMEIINCIEDGKPRFIHKTFAAYFVAGVLIHWLSMRDMKDDKCLRLLRKIFVVEPGIRKFFNYYLNRLMFEKLNAQFLNNWKTLMSKILPEEKIQWLNVVKTEKLENVTVLLSDNICSG